MAKRKNKQQGAMKGQPAIGPRQHLMNDPSDSSIGLVDEGRTPVQHKGEVRTDQSKGHHGGSQRQTQNRGRH